MSLVFNLLDKVTYCDHDITNHPPVNGIVVGTYQEGTSFRYLIFFTEAIEGMINVQFQYDTYRRWKEDTKLLESTLTVISEKYLHEHQGEYYVWVDERMLTLIPTQYTLDELIYQLKDGL